MYPLTVVHSQQTLLEKHWSKIATPIRIPVKNNLKKNKVIVLCNLQDASFLIQSTSSLLLRDQHLHMVLIAAVIVLEGEENAFISVDI